MLTTKGAPNNTTGADGVNVAVLRKGRAGSMLIWAAAHAHVGLSHLLHIEFNNKVKL